MATIDARMTDDKPAPKLFAVSPLKFAAMAICTFGIYEIYWSYKNWKYVKERNRNEIMPFWRAFFYPLWHYSLLTELNKTLESPALSSPGFRAGLAVSVLVLNALWRLPDPYWLVSLFSFIAFLPAILAIQAYESANPVYEQPRQFHPANLLAYFIGGPLFVFVTLGSIGLIPGTVVVPGDALWNRDIEYLREAEILGPNEEIEHFYSEGIWSVAEGGQFVSKDYVTSYYRDPETGETYIGYAAYSDIKDIDIAWAESFLDSTIVTVTTNDDFEFQLFLSSEAGGDRKFVEAMTEHWEKLKLRGQ